MAKAAPPPRWQTQLHILSFRDIPFRWRDTGYESGRRVVVTEFPLRDVPFTEDLGRSARRFPINGYVVQDPLTNNYYQNRDDLIAALEKPGPGTLIHPYRGPITCQVLSFRVKEDQAEGGMASFEIMFAEAGGAASPVAVTDTAAQSIAAAQQLYNASYKTFTNYLDFASFAAFIQASQVSTLSKLLSQFNALLAIPNQILDQVQAAISQYGGQFSAVAQSIGSIIGLASAVQAVFTTFISAVTTPPVDTTALGTADLSGNIFIPTAPSPGLVNYSRLPGFFDLTTDPTYGLGTLAQFGNSLPPVLGTSADRNQQRRNQIVTALFVQSTAVASIAIVFAKTTFQNSQDALSALGLVNDLIDDLVDQVADQNFDQLYLSLMQMQGLLTADLTVRAAQLPHVIPYSIPDTLPSLALSELLYQDASFDQQLVAQNRAVHPLFCPNQGEALTQ